VRKDCESAPFCSTVIMRSFLPGGNTHERGKRCARWRLPLRGYVADSSPGRTRRWIDGTDATVTALSPDADENAITQRFCGECGQPISPGTAFCGECGSAQSAPAVPPRSAAAKATPTLIEPVYAHHPPLTPPVTPPPHGGAPPAQPPTAPGMAAYPYAYPQPGYPAPPAAGRHTSLLIGLVLAAVLALGAVVAVVLLAAGGNQRGVTLSNASSGALSTGGSSGPAGAGVTPTAGPTPTAATHAGAAASGGAAPSGGIATGSAATTVQRHWQLIGQGDYEGAFALFSPSYQNHLGHDTWVGDKRLDRPSVSSLVVGTPQITSATTATVPLASLHTVGQEAPRCHDWTGSYDLTKVNGTWLINQASLTSTTC
jgi:hypothetical protein